MKISLSQRLLIATEPILNETRESQETASKPQTTDVNFLTSNQVEQHESL